MGAQVKNDKSVEMEETKGEVVTMTNKKEEAPMENGKRNIPVLEYTEADFEALSQEDLLEVMTPRISERRALKILTDVLADGTVAIAEPETLSDWTYKAVAVEGVDLKDINGSKTPKVTLKQKTFEELDGAAVSKYIAEYTTEKRSSQIMLALMEYGLVLTPEQVVGLSNNRIKIEGVTLPRNVVKKDSVVLVKGVQVNGNGK